MDANTQPVGRTISLDNAVEFEAWARCLGLSPEQLMLVVESAGTDVGTVRGYLNWNYQPIRSAR